MVVIQRRVGRQFVEFETCKLLLRALKQLIVVALLELVHPEHKGIEAFREPGDERVQEEPEDGDSGESQTASVLWPKGQPCDVECEDTQTNK